MAIVWLFSAQFRPWQLKTGVESDSRCQKARDRGCRGLRSPIALVEVDFIEVTVIELSTIPLVIQALTLFGLAAVRLCLTFE
jgi:hypothetical protein